MHHTFRRTFIVLSMSEGFEEKFINFIHNFNTLNEDQDNVIKVEKVYKEPVYAVVPIETINKEEGK